MKTLTWTVKFNWDYDLERYVEKTINYIKENNLNFGIEKDLKKIERFIGQNIHFDLAGEDDDLYYNFSSDETYIIINEVVEEIKNNYSTQIPLDL